MVKTRVAFRDPNGTLLRYVERIPHVGDASRGLARERLIVSRVEEEEGRHVVLCVTPLQFARDRRAMSRAARAVSADARTLAQELRQRAAETKRRVLARRL